MESNDLKNGFSQVILGNHRLIHNIPASQIFHGSPQQSRRATEAQQSSLPDFLQSDSLCQENTNQSYRRVEDVCPSARGTLSRSNPILGNVIVIGVDEYGGMKDLEERPASTCISIESICQAPMEEVQEVELPASPSFGSRATNVNNEMALNGKVSLKDRPFKIDITPETVVDEAEDNKREPDVHPSISPEAVTNYDNRNPTAHVTPSVIEPHGRLQVEHDKQMQSEFDVILSCIAEESRCKFLNFLLLGA